MKNNADRFGMIIAIAITASAIAFVSILSDPQDRNLQPQGQAVIDRTTSELKEIPKTAKNTLTDTVDELKEIPTEVEDMLNDVEDIPQESVEKIENVLPDVPNVVKQTDGKLLELISIPRDTSMPGCEQSNECYIPEIVKIYRGGEVIWENHDNAAHTVTSGSASTGPNGLFDSGLIYPGDTYSIQLDLVNEYVYFCQVHPWMTGKIVVK